MMVGAVSLYLSEQAASVTSVQKECAEFSMVSPEDELSAAG